MCSNFHSVLVLTALSVVVGGVVLAACACVIVLFCVIYCLQQLLQLLLEVEARRGVSTGSASRNLSMSTAPTSTPITDRVPSREIQLAEDYDESPGEDKPILLRLRQPRY